MMKVSVIIPTYNRPAYLEKCIESLLKQRKAPDEIIVIVRLSDTASYKILEKYQARAHASLPIKLIEIARPGIVYAENRGLKAAMGDIVCFMDDDATAPENWIADIVRHYERDPSIGGVGGPVITIINNNPVNLVISSRMTWFGKRIAGNTKMPADIREVDLLNGCNMSFRRSLLTGFDEYLLPYWRRFEDDACLSVKERGYKIIYDPALTVQHFDAAIHEGMRIDKTPETIIGLHHNSIYIKLKHLKGLSKIIALFYEFIWGDITTPGFFQILGYGVKHRTWSSFPELAYAMVGKVKGIITYMHYNLHAPSLLKREGMRVSFCTCWRLEKDGIADYSGHMVDALKKRGLEIDVIELRPYLGERAYYRKVAHEASAADIAHIQFNYLYFNGTLPYRNTFLYFARHLKSPAVMTVHEVYIGYKPPISGFSNPVNKVIFNNTLFLWNALSRDFHRRMYNIVDKVIVHTRCQAELILPLLEKAGKLTVIPHAIPAVKEEDMDIASSEAKRRLCLDGRTVLTVFGFIKQQKGYETVLDAIAGLPDNVVFLIAGGLMSENPDHREYFDKLTGQISARGLSDRVRITGYLRADEIPSVMAATDIALAPFSTISGSGSLSLTIAYHKPIIASDIPVHREINERVPCLELFNPGNPAELRSAIKRVLGDIGRINALSAASREYSSRFSYGNIAGMTARLYEEVIQAHRGR